MENSIKEQGYCILTPTISGLELVWRVIGNDEDEDFPEIFETLLEARQSIVDSYIDYLRDFLFVEEGGAGNLAWEILDKEITDTVGYLELFEDGTLYVWNVTDNGIKDFLEIETTLQEWRNDL